MVLKARGSDTIDLVLQLHAETDKAWRVSDDGNIAKAKWLAKSQVQQGERKGPAMYEYTVPEWIAVQNGWV